MSSTEVQEPILSSDFAPRRRSLWFGEIELYENHLAISGWAWTGYTRDAIPLEDVREVEKRVAYRGTNFVIRLEEDQDLYVRLVDGPFYWLKQFREDDRTDVTVRT